MTCSEAGLERTARVAEFERLAGALDEAQYLIEKGYEEEAYEYLLEVFESCPDDSIFLDWFRAAISVIVVSDEVRAVLAN